MIKKIPCFIFARKGSKGLKNKNLRKINNKPLIYYTIKHAQNSNYIDDIIVSTDSEPIYKYAFELIVYEERYNILEIQNGMAGLLFSR